ncbi:hypothetical protein KM043_006920 [Ampulex compressa]|nr:hypothetical protein KM043_006920 [Ampulex compressa]
MGKAVGNSTNERNCVNGTSVSRQRRKVKTKKMRRKKDLEDLHQKVLKAKKKLREKTLPRKLSQSAFGKLLNQFADKRQEYDKRTQAVNEKSGRLQEHRKICARLLPKPRTGMYKNGAVGKGIRRDNVVINDSTDARQRGDLFRLLNGYQSSSTQLLNTEVHNESLRSPIFNLQNEKCSPVLGKVQGISRKHKIIRPQEERISQNWIFPDDDSEHQENHPRKFSSKHKHSLCSPYEQYVELCETINSEISASCTFLEDFLPDPLLSIKTKLRNVYTNARLLFHACDKKKREEGLNAARATINENMSLVAPDFCGPTTIINYDKNGLQNRKNYGKDILEEHSYGNERPSLNSKKREVAQKLGRNNVHNTYLSSHFLPSKSTNGMTGIFVQPSDNFAKSHSLDTETNMADFESDDFENPQGATEEDFENFVLHLRTKNRGKPVGKDSIFTSSASSSIGNNSYEDKCTKLISSPENVLNKHFEKLNVIAPKAKSFKLVPSILRRNRQNRGQKKDEDMSKYLNRPPQNSHLRKVSARNAFLTPASSVNDRQNTFNADPASTSTKDELQHGFSTVDALHFLSSDLNQPREIQMYYPKQPLAITLHQPRKDPRGKKQKPNLDKSIHSHYKIFSTSDVHGSTIANSHSDHQTIPDNRMRQLECRHCHRSFHHTHDQAFDLKNHAESSLTQNVAHDRITDCVTHENHNAPNVSCLKSYHGFQYNDRCPREDSANLLFEREHSMCPTNWRISRAAQDRVTCTKVDRCRSFVDPMQGLDFVAQPATAASIKSQRIRAPCFCEETDTFLFQEAQDAGISSRGSKPRASTSSQPWNSDASLLADISQPVKYLACEGNSKPERMPVYACGASNAAKVLLLPAKCGERTKCQPAVPVICVNPRDFVKCPDLDSDRCSCSTKIIPCEPEYKCDVEHPDSRMNRGVNMFLNALPKETSVSKIISVNVFRFMQMKYYEELDILFCWAKVYRDV